MITIDDCQAFCDAPPSQIEELARREGLALVQACALAHTLTRREAGCDEASQPVRQETAMMTMQAREMFPRLGNETYPLRPYSVDSPRAMARLVVLALLADGQLDERELDALNRRGAFAALGIRREDFVQVLYDFCADVAKLGQSDGGYRLSPALLSRLFAEVDEPRKKQRVLNLIISVISTDGRLSEGEEKLFLGAMSAWRMGAESGDAGRARRRQSLPPETSYC